MGIDVDFPKAFAKSQAAAGSALPTSGSVFISVADRDKRAVVLPALRLNQLGFELWATEGTNEVLARHGIAARVVRKHSGASDGEPSIVDLINAGEVDIVINTPSGRAARADGIDVGDLAWGLLTPVHWHLGTEQVSLVDPAALALDEAVRSGREVPGLLQQAYYASVASLIGEQAMDSGKAVDWPRALPPF